MAATHYAKSDRASLAYRVDNEEGPTLLHVPGALSNLALEDTIPPVARYFERLSRFCRLIRFDKRGTGLSDRGNMPLTLADQVPDVEAVREATKSERVVLYRLSQGAAVAVLYALAFPERVTHLILVSVQHTAERRFAAVLFTDIVDSTAQQHRRGDREWRSVLESHEANAGRLAEQFGGSVVEVQGDGVLAAFPTTGDGIRAALAMVKAARSLGVQIRACLHTGEVYEVGERLLGICVNVAARVVAQAGANEVLTTELVQGLLEGSNFEFSDAGVFELKGIGSRQLVRVA